MVRSELDVSFWATTIAWWRLQAMPITMMNGTIVQAISTVVLSWKSAGLCPFGLAVREDGIEHHAEHAHEDHHADPQQHIVDVDLATGDRGRRLTQVELEDFRPPGHVGNGLSHTGQTAQSGRSHRTRDVLESHAVTKESCHVVL
jgi:hypothetical protein